MKVSGILLQLSSFLLFTEAASATADSCCKSDIVSSAHHERILNNYLAIWNGDLSLVKSVFHPDVVLFSDRFPSSTGNGSEITGVTNRAEFASFVTRSRTGWASYEFTTIRSVSSGYDIAVRWKMDGVLGKNFTLFPTPLKPGSHVTYNGTDFLVLDECTGQVREDYIAQDLISYFHAMGLDAITV
ncbi:hypothetical protein N7456_002698 [Penicillium angulare]|uniref:SnoaL-like domain-containing protein n=1 Tax=Penicillium angulare TaxID=116970 RepID=A0A9W9KP92_9EURO|nr:hypothetical protein N7456_002698 [Penicillium angulare]